MSTDNAQRIYYACKTSEQQKLIASIVGKLKLHDGESVFPASDGMPPEATFRIDEFMDKLEPSSVYGTVLFYAPLVPSTQTFLVDNVHLLPVGTACVADVQSAGKGRGENTWDSRKGCLMFSFTMQMKDGDEPFVQYVATLAMVNGIEAACEAKGVPAPDLRIKWPNDLYAGDLKIGGVLCSPKVPSSIVVGIGLNVDNKKPTTCLNALLRDTALDKEELLAAILTSFEELFSLFSAQGFKPLEDRYYQKWLHSDQKVAIQVKDSVVIKGLTPSGCLLARDNGRNEYGLHPDQNTLFEGVIKRKLDQ